MTCGMDKLIVNPYANKGRAKVLLPEIIRQLRQLGLEFDIQKTQSPGQATAFARQAAANGYNRVIAVGGDGTCYEMVNGLLSAAKEGQTVALGIIPIGSGNDLAYALGIPTDITRACMLLKYGSVRMIDVGQVTVDGEPHFFANNVGLGLDAEVVIASRKARALRGFLKYLGSALWAVFFGRWPYHADFSFNGSHHQQEITLFTVANGRRSGGGFILTPQAELADGLLDICYVSRLSKAEALRLLPLAIKGDHIHHRAVTMSQSDRIDVFVDTGIPGHIDGEILCVRGRRFTFETLPKALRVWA